MSPHTTIAERTEQRKPQTPPEDKPKKSVRFHGQCTVCLIPDLADYSEVERYMVWHEREEYELFKRDCLEVVDLMRRGVPEHECLTFRGLEWKARGASKKRQFVRYRAQMSVFEEQDQHWKRNENACPLKIAAACRPYNMMSRQEALQRGCADANVIYPAAIASTAATGDVVSKSLVMTSTRSSQSTKSTLYCGKAFGHDGRTRRVIKSHSRAPGSLFRPV